MTVHCAQCEILIAANRLLEVRATSAEARLASAIESARADEREACALVAAAYPVSVGLGKNIADAIRARGVVGTLEQEIRAALNRHSAENGSNTPDFILCGYLLACLEAFDVGVRQREEWCGRKSPPPVVHP